MKNIVITGSTRGIGFAMAKAFLKDGCQVTLSGRGEALSDAAKADLYAYVDHYIYIPCDVQNKDSLSSLFLASVTRWGGVDIFISNAGQNTPHLFSWETNESDTQNIIQTNITGMILGSQIAAAMMIKQGHGAIYSMEGLGSNNMIQKKTILYGTTKHALTYFMKGLAKELETTGVIAGRLSPGMMLTDFITKSPDGSPSEVLKDERFRKIFNILADTPEPVAAFLTRKMLRNTRNNVRFAWLTSRKAAWRFLTAPFRKNRLIGQDGVPIV